MRFGYLDGAIVAAKAIGEWARRSDFGEENVRVVTDERLGAKDNPVTRERVQKAVDELFADGAERVEQLLLAFCGHGLTDANVGAISWLFSDSLRSKYRVISDAFYAELLLHGVERITLITDACREAPKDLDLMRLDPVRGIAVDGNQVDSPKFDRLAACQDGQLGYMVSDPTSAEPGKCVFSGVIADVLWGTEPSAIANGVITTATFGACVRSRTGERAKEYKLKLNPQCLVDPEPAVLYDSAKPPKGPPLLQPWPAARAATRLGADAAAAAGDADRNLDLVEMDPQFRDRILGTNFALDRPDSPAAADLLRIPTGSKKLLQELVGLRLVSEREAPTAAREERAEALVNRLEADAVSDVRKRAAGQVRRSLVQIRPSIEPGGSNLIVSREHASIWSRTAVERLNRTRARTGYHADVDPSGAPILVEFEDGSFTPVVLYESLYTLVKRSFTGEVFQAYGERHLREPFKRALQAIADFGAGRLDAERVDELAAEMRHGKHADPVLGVISAYLYRAVADYDSIRRMAFFYVEQGQPVPFDIALLGEMAVTGERHGPLTLHIPAVKARAHQAALPHFVSAETPARRGAVGGRCPWMGVGWDHVGLVRADAASLVEGLADLAPEIPRTGFTLLPGEAGRQLAQMWKLQPSDG